MMLKCFAIHMLIELLTEAQKSSQIANDLQHRVPSLQLAIVANVDDPLGQRRIQVIPRSKALNGHVSDWIKRFSLIPGFDPHLPVVGSTVLIGSIDGDPHDQFWLGPFHNDTNPADATQEDFKRDTSLEMPGNNRHTVGGWDKKLVQGDRSETVRGDLGTSTEGMVEHHTNKEHYSRADDKFTLDSGDRLLLRNDASAAIYLHESGDIIAENMGGKLIISNAGTISFTNRQGQTITLAGDGNCSWDLAGSALNIVNAADVTINGHSIIVLGSVDTRGSANVTKGY